MAAVFMTGVTGYLGRPLATTLVERGHAVRGLARRGSEGRVPVGVEPVTGDVLDVATWRDACVGADTLVHLVGTPKPNPAKAQEFRDVDLTSIRAATAAARHAGVRHIVYVSVAHPAPVMQAYIAVRQEGERLVRETGIPATIVRPWYVLGPGHWWPCALIPLYALLRALPPTRDGANRLGLVTLAQMVATLAHAVEHPPAGLLVVEVPGIRRGGT